MDIDLWHRTCFSGKQMPSNKGIKYMDQNGVLKMV